MGGAPADTAARLAIRAPWRSELCRRWCRNTRGRGVRFGMKPWHLLIPSLFLSIGLESLASPVFPTGAGSAVGVVDRSATFVSTPSTVVSLSDSSDDSLINGVADTSFIHFGNPIDELGIGSGGRDGFHYEAGGNYDFVPLRETDDAVMFSVEFMVSTEASSSVTGLRWETLIDSEVTGTGEFRAIALENIRFKLAPSPVAPPCAPRGWWQRKWSGATGRCSAHPRLAFGLPSTPAAGSE